MTRIDLIRVLMNTDLTEHKNLTRNQARAAVNEIFDSIADALRDGDMVQLPFGSFAVFEHDHKPTRAWILGRVRVTYRTRNHVQFRPDEKVLEPEIEVGSA